MQQIATSTHDIQTKKDALRIIGGLGKPSKMPGKTYGISADLCKTGGKLRKVPGSTCSDCYACKGQYQFQTVKAAHAKRLDKLQHDPRWVSAMVKAIGKEKHFRWHDSGDLQSLEHLEKIMSVVALTPDTAHWLPTREKGIVSRYLQKYGEFPSNVAVRLSAPMIDQKPIPLDGVLTSTVHKEQPPIGFACRAPDQGNECKDCRACWDKNISNVSYLKH